MIIIYYLQYSVCEVVKFLLQYPQELKCSPSSSYSHLF